MPDYRSAAAQAYRSWYKTARWRYIREHQLRTEPLCRMCMGQGNVTAATISDHITPHRGDEVQFFSGPFQSLCKAHHDSAKQSEDLRGYSAEVGIDGYPLDPKHPANG